MMPRMFLVIFGLFTLVASYSLYSSDTILRLYKPFSTNPTEKMTNAMQRQVKGQCWQQSQRIKREDAWRCQYEDKTIDPCFIKTYGSHKEARCPQSPWDNQSIVIALENPVENLSPESLDFSRTLPWGLELSTGEKCLSVEEGRYFDNMPVRYVCDEKSLLFGNIQRCKTLWTILQQKNGLVETVEIKKAWF